MEKLNIKEIKASPLNSRRIFDEIKLGELSISIQQKGILNPLLVRPSNGKYEIVCGERRFKAAQLVGLTEVPVIVKQLTDQEALEFQIIENLQREDLGAMEEAAGFKLMLEKCKYTAADLATKVGKSPAYISLRIRLLELPKEIQDAIAKDELTPGHGIVLLRVKDPTEQKELFQEIKREKLSVRAAENQLNDLGQELDEAIFDAKGCLECEHNGARHKDLFDKETNLKGRCMNKACFLAKCGAEILKKRDALLKEGRKVVTGDKFNSSSAIELLDEYGRFTYRKESLGAAYTVKCKACPKLAFVITKERGNGIQHIMQYCTDKECYDKLTRSPSEKKGADNYSTQLKKAKTENRIDAARRAFWITKVSTAKDQRSMRVVILDILLHDLSAGVANSLLPFKARESYYAAWNIPKLYDLGDAAVQQLIVKVISKKAEYLMDNDLKFLSEKLGFMLKKDFVITEMYLNAFTKDQLVKLAYEIGLVKFLKAKKITGLEEMKKTELIDLFLKKGFKLEGQVPKEIL